MSQQLANGSYRKGGVTYTVRMSMPYAVVGVPYGGKWRKPQTAIAKARRKEHWEVRNNKLK